MLQTPDRITELRL